MESGPVRSPLSRDHGLGDRGFSLLEILVGLGVLSIVLAGLGMFFKGQVHGLLRSNQLSDATQIALTQLEEMKGRLSDPGEFRDRFEATEHGPDHFAKTVSANDKTYEVVTTLDRAAEPLYGLRLRSRVSWRQTHLVELGLLVPGPSPTL